MSVSMQIAAHAATIAFAMVAGAFLAFSDFIVRALARTSGTGGVEAMQTINREVFRWVFMALFLGLTPISLIISLYGLFVIEGLAGTLLAAAGLAYVLGCFGVTVSCNVPLNETLARMSASDDATATFWSETYVPRWRFWNTVRTLACAISAVLMAAALAVMPSP